MGLRVATNLASLNARLSLGTSQRAIAKSFAQLSSGSRITRAADDAAGLSISETLKSSLKSYVQAQRNANDGISMVQVSEGSLGQISSILTRFRELAVQASSDTIGDVERGFIDKEVQQMKAEIERIAQTTRFGTTQLLNGEGGVFAFQVDMNNDDDVDRISFDSSEQNATPDALGVDGLDYTDKSSAQEALETLELSQKKVNGLRANLGAIQNRLITASENLGTSIENVSAANSQIRDTDVAESTAELTRNQILLSSTIGVLAQANQAPMNALKLIG